MNVIKLFVNSSDGRENRIFDDIFFKFFHVITITHRIDNISKIFFYKVHFPVLNVGIYHYLPLKTSFKHLRKLS